MLCNLREQVYATRKSNIATETLDVLYRWRVDLAMRFSVLWRSTLKDDRWELTGHIELGILQTPSGRAKLIPGKYRKAVVFEARKASGQGIRTPRQLMVGMRVSRKRGPTVRLGRTQLKAMQRSAAKRQDDHTAKSQDASASGQVTHADPRYNYFDEYNCSKQYNYLCDSRPGQLFGPRVVVRYVGFSMTAKVLLIGNWVWSELVG